MTFLCVVANEFETSNKFTDRKIFFGPVIWLTENLCWEGRLKASAEKWRVSETKNYFFNSTLVLIAIEREKGHKDYDTWPLFQ